MGFVRPKTGREAETFFRWCARRTMKLNKNVIVVVVGAPGAGKSYWCLRAGEKMLETLGKKKKYDVNYCCRDLNEFMELLNSKKLHKGDVVTLEEVGVNIDARSWQGKMNKLINYIFQTFRNKNLVCFLNLPDLEMLDKNTRRLIHGVVNMRGINKAEEKVRFTFKVRQHNYEMHKDYFKFLRSSMNGRIRKVSMMSLNKPSEDLIKVYEERRLEFTKKLSEDIEKQLEVNKQKEALKIHGGNGRPFTDKQQALHDVYHSGITKGLDIAKALGMKPNSVSEMSHLMDKKYPIWRETPRK